MGILVTAETVVVGDLEWTLRGQRDACSVPAAIFRSVNW